MLKSRALICALLTLSATAVSAQQRRLDSLPGLGAPDKVTDPTAVQPGLYYTQLKVETSGFQTPFDERAGKSLGRALLESLGVRKEAKSVVVSIAVRSNITAYPEYPLLSYNFDGSSRLLNVSQTGTVTFPLQRLDPSEPLSVTLSYRYSDQVAFDPKKATEAISGLLPGTTLVSAVTQPLVTKVADAAAKIFSLSSSQTQLSSIAEQMSPYGAGYAKWMRLTMKLPDGRVLGYATLSLLATPTLQRTPAPVNQAGATDFRLRPGESATTLALSIAGVEKFVVTELKGLKEFVRLSKERTPESAKDFCDAARLALATQMKLTILDRAAAMHQTMYDADAGLTRGSWYDRCFDRDERLMLASASSDLGPPPVVQATAGISASPVPKAIKDALGCLMTAQTGPYCTTYASNPSVVLQGAMAESIRVGQIDIPGLIDVGSLDPTTRLLDRDTLLQSFAGRASSFGCYQKGLIIGTDNARAFRVGLTMSGDKVSAISIIAAPQSDLQCV